MYDAGAEANAAVARVKGRHLPWLNGGLRACLKGDLKPLAAVTGWDPMPVQHAFHGAGASSTSTTSSTWRARKTAPFKRFFQHSERL